MSEPEAGKQTVEISTTTYNEAERLRPIFADKTGCKKEINFFIDAMLIRGMDNYITEVLSVEDLMGGK